MSPSTVDASALDAEIARALRQAFGDQPVQDLSVLTGGRSGATLLSLTVAGTAYVVRKADPTRPAHETRIAREVACLRIASELGVAPELRHVDVATGVSIMQKIEAAPLDRCSRRGSRRIERVANALRRLHQGPAFPAGATVVDVVRHVDQALRARGAEGLPERLVRTVDELGGLTARFAETAPCHNDLNPGNILETDDAVYFVDWETACASDPFVDLAELGVFAFPSTDERAELLEAYLGRRPTEQDRARATVARVMALGFYATAFIYSMMPGCGSVFASAPLPLPELLALLGRSRAGASAQIVAASLFEEMRRESGTEAFEAACRQLRNGS